MKCVVNGFLRKCFLPLVIGLFCYVDLFAMKSAASNDGNFGVAYARTGSDSKPGSPVLRAEGEKINTTLEKFRSFCDGLHRQEPQDIFASLDLFHKQDASLYEDALALLSVEMKEEYKAYAEEKSRKEVLEDNRRVQERAVIGDQLKQDAMEGMPLFELCLEEEQNSDQGPD